MEEMGQRYPTPEEEAEIRRQLKEMFLNYETMPDHTQTELVLMKFRLDREIGKYA